MKDRQWAASVVAVDDCESFSIIHNAIEPGRKDSFSSRVSVFAKKLVKPFVVRAHSRGSWIAQGDCIPDGYAYRGVPSLIADKATYRLREGHSRTAEIICFWHLRKWGFEKWKWVRKPAECVVKIAESLGKKVSPNWSKCDEFKQLSWFCDILFVREVWEYFQGLFKIIIHSFFKVITVRMHFCYSKLEM